jgi:chromosome segregation protein
MAKQTTDTAEPSHKAADVDVLRLGATWQRVDLHLHTPGVSTFSCPPGLDPKKPSDKDQLIERYVDQLLAQGISICAITDYNGIRVDWFSPIRDAASRQGIKVLPGAEVSFKTGKYGLHVLAIFPEETDSSSVNSFLQSFDRDAARPLFDLDRSHRDIDPRQNVADLLLSLRDRFRCLLIPPHPDQDNGICKSLQPGDAAKLLIEIHPDALEHCPLSEIQKLRSTAIDGIKFLEHLATVEFSDPKRIEDIGTKSRKDGQARATYLKLSASDVDALRLALHDPATRLALGSVPASNHARIRRLDVSGSGFLGNLKIAWNDDLNVIIGGRGAGKSAIIETLRYALGMESYSEGSYRSDLVHHALGSGGKATVILDIPIGKDKVRSCRIVRVWGEDARVFEFDSDRPTSLRPIDLFGSVGSPTIFGQREIYAVSGSEEYRLRLLDDLIGEDAKQRAKEVAIALDLLRENARAIVNTGKKLSKREEYRQRLKTIEHDIGVYEKYGVAQKLELATGLRIDGQHLRAGIDAVVSASSIWMENGNLIPHQLQSAGKNLKKAQSQHKDILGKASDTIERLTTGLNNLFTKGEELFKEAKLSLTEISSAWQEALKPLEDDLNRIKQEVKAEKLDPDRLLQLSEERTAIAPQIEELDRAEMELKALVDRRVTLVSDIRDRRHREYELRRQRAETIAAILGERLQLQVEFKGQKEEYKKRLLALLKGSGVSADAVERLGVPDATDGIALAEAIRTGPSQIQDRFDLTAGMAERLVRWFSENEARLFELETIIPGDALRVELRIDGGARPLGKLSPGQRATAILLLLFAQPGRMLILDQPEDDLDNRFIYEDVVQILRDQKGHRGLASRRQIIAATHNPNIPVIGDAELVLALEAHDGKTKIVGRASIDDRKVCELIKSIMEGGEEAFRRRAEKYGGV